ncbi:MAG: bifunctional 4-hydroxy-2-oxoglutarate aldolase/2-dehydro-3-deoxy-phosphogluconate aldolase [Armatimonadota bacterium]
MTKPRGMKVVEEAIYRQKFVPVLRHSNEPVSLDLLQALAAEGVNCIEIALTSPRALTSLRWARDRLPDGIILGAGSALNAEMARLAIRAGAEFVASPGLNEAMIDVCRRADVLAIPGIMTPTETMRAWHAGAHLVKMFPASVLGPEFLSAIHGPLPWLRMMPTGGITDKNAAVFIRAGAVAVGLGSWLINEEEALAKRWQPLRERLKSLRDALRDATRHAT